MCSPAGGIIAQETTFADGHDHLLAEIDLLKLLLHRQVLRIRASGRLVENAFRGLFIADEQVDAILDERPVAFGAGAIAARAADKTREIASRLSASVEARIPLPLLRMASLVGLTTFECSVVAACAATDLDLDFETLYAYVQNDVNRKRPTVDLLLKILCQSPVERLQHRDSFSSEGLLFQWAIVRPSDAAENSSFLARGLTLDPRVTEFLLDRDGIDSRLVPFTRRVHGGLRMRNVLLPETLKTALANITAHFEQCGGVILLHGSEGVGKRTVAAALSVLQNRPLISVDLSLAAASSLPFSEILVLLKREALLTEANLLLEHAHALAPQQSALLEQSLASCRNVVFVTSESAEFRLRTAAPAAIFAIPVPGVEHRQQLWLSAAAKTLRPFPAVDFSGLARKFALSGGQIHNACGSAALAACSQHGEHARLTPDLLESAVREQSARGLVTLAVKVESKQSWTDLILAPRSIHQLQAVSTAYRFRHEVYTTWGFGDKVSMGNGLNILFFGPSGTGKTMAAGILANALSLDLYKIDLSTVVSKYIGETEKQLSQIFRQAQASQAILLFDEADALFGKRSEVKDAHDRYANVETSYLLQKMEEYQGIVILTTNLRNNIDDAFARRMHHIVEFPFPDVASRSRMWKGLLPTNAPIADDADLGFLARQFEFSGGNIRNALVAAAFMAAEESSAIRMSHLIVAAAREMQKLGKIPSKADFRQYFDLIHSRV